MAASPKGPDYKATREYKIFTLALPLCIYGLVGLWPGGEFPIALRIGSGVLALLGSVMMFRLIYQMLHRPHRH